MEIQPLQIGKNYKKSPSSRQKYETTQSNRKQTITNTIKNSYQKEHLVGVEPEKSKKQNTDKKQQKMSVSQQLTGTSTKNKQLQSYKSTQTISSPKKLKDNKTISAEQLCSRIKGNITLLNLKMEELIYLSKKQQTPKKSNSKKMLS